VCERAFNASRWAAALDCHRSDLQSANPQYVRIVERPWISWTRWWTPLGGPIHLEQAGGFLTDPRSEFARFYPLNVFQLDDLLQRHCLVLCGEPGMGKTAELNELEERLAAPSNAAKILRVNFRSCLDAADFHKKVFQSADWKVWQQSPHHLRLIVDGVDEGLWLAPNFVEWFIDELRTDLPLDRLSVILACRTLEWPQAVGRQLAALWGEPKHDEEKPIGVEFELCPLTRTAVVESANAHHLAPNDFFRAVQERQVHGLAARPLTLFMLLDEFAERGGNLTRSHRQLYVDFCKRLCDEPDPQLARRLRRRKAGWSEYRPSQKEVVAGRIAAMMFLTAKSSVVVDKPIDSASTDITIADIAAGKENDGSEDFPVTNDLVEATLATGLFNSKGGTRHGFEHQTFAECLAAQYLAKIDFGPLRTLLLRQDEGGAYVVPQLAELASWLAGEREDIFDLLLCTQPEILLRADLSHLGNLRKEQVVDALLRKAANAEFFERHAERRPFYGALAHPALSNQLRAIILDGRKNSVVRWLALDIATACKCRDLFPALLTILKRGSDPISKQVGYALDDLVDDESAPQLIPIADGTFVPMQSRSVRVSALRGLVMTTWSVAEALPVAKKIVRSADFLDWTLAERVRPQDVEDGLKALTGCNGIFDSLFRLRKVAMRLLHLALEQLHDTDVLASLTDILVPELRAYRLERWSNLGGFGKALQADPEKRRVIIRALHKRLTETQPDKTWQVATLCFPEDVPWLLDVASSCAESERETYFAVIRPLLHPDFIWPHWDEIIERLNNSEALKAVKEWFDAWPLKGARARAARAEQKKQNVSRKRHQKVLDRQRLPERKPRLTKLLAASRAGKTDAWTLISRTLFITDTRQWASDVPSHDVVQSPGWIAATEPQRDEIRQAARRFLLGYDKEFVREPNQSTYGAEAAFVAAWLLRSEIAAPGPLQDAFAQKCVPAVVWHHGSDDAVGELTALAYPLNPKRCREAYLEELDFDAGRDAGTTLAPQAFLKCWDSELTQVTERFLLLKRRRPETIRSLFAELAHVDLAAIPQIWRKLAARAVKQGRVGAQRAAAASELMIELFCEEFWDELFPFLTANREVARLAILRSSAYGDYRIDPTRDVSDEHLSLLYMLVYRIFSPSDPEEQWDDSGQPRSVTARLSVARFRDSLVDRLVAKGTPAACNAIRRIVNGVAREHRLWMKKRWLDCIELVRRKAWNPIGPEQLLEIARRRNAYWIESNDDLVLVVLESLDELRRSIRNSSSGDILDFWQYKRRGGRLSEQRPKAEVDVARKVYTWLQQSLASKHGAIIHREVTIQWDQRRTDIEVVVAARPQQRWPEAAVVLEVKHSWNAGVRVDVKRQLRDRYLKRIGRTRGIYVVTWFECSIWRPSRRVLRAHTIASAKKEVATICGRASKPPVSVTPYVLDCSFPN
jgi:hypothetical protein